MHEYPEDIITEYEPALPLKLIERRHEYEDVYSFIFTKPEGFSFYAGQNVRLHIPGLPEDENTRSMSMASTPSDDSLLFSMHTSSGSLFKQATLSLKTGEEVHVVKRKGVTIWPCAMPAKVVFIAGGVGVTPFRSLMYDAVQRGLSVDIELLHVSSGSYLYEDEIRELPCQQTRIWRPDVMKKVNELVLENPSALYYVIGPPTFTEAITQLLEQQGVNEEEILKSRFSGYDSFVQ